MTSFLTIALSRQLKMSVIHNFIVIPLFLNELSSNLVWENKIKRKEICKQIIAQNLIFFIIFNKREKLDSDFGRFLAKHLLRIRLLWQQLRSLVTKMYTK